jgi:fructose-bisphosphate aldolase class II
MKAAVQPLNIERLDAIREKTGVPIVLHGASGVICTRADAEKAGIKLAAYEGTIEDAVKHGISKINVATELSMEFLRGIKEALAARPGEKDMRKILLPGKELVKEKVRSYIKLFGCAGKGRMAGASGITSSEIKYHE